MSFRMQARSSTTGALITWTAASADFAAAGFPGPGSAQDVAISMRPVGAGGGAGSSAVVAHYYNPSTTGLSAISQLNGVFYTVPSGQAGLYRLSVTFGTPAAFAVGVDSAQVLAYLNGVPSQDSVRIVEDFTLYQGGEGTQAQLHSRPADLLLKSGDTLHLTSDSGGTVSVAVRLERIALVADL